MNPKHGQFPQAKPAVRRNGVCHDKGALAEVATVGVFCDDRIDAPERSTLEDRFWWCTRPQGHTGEHIARNGGVEVCERWPNDSTVASAGVLPTVAAKGTAPIPAAPEQRPSGRGAARSRKAKGPLESIVQKQVMDWLKTQRHVFWERQNSGAMTAEHKGKKRFIRFSRPGASDIRCCVRGRYVAVEVKRDGGVQTEEQVAWQADLERAGGLYFVVRSVDDARLAFRTAGLL